MHFFLDERCLQGNAIEGALRLWMDIAGVAQNVEAVELLIDRRVLGTPEFLAAFGRLREGVQQILRAFVFRPDVLGCWRPGRNIGFEYLLATEANRLRERGACEAYEHGANARTAAIVGFESSSYADQRVVDVSKFELDGAGVGSRTLDVATSFSGFLRLGREWGFLPLEYDRSSARPPRDTETALAQQPDRFERTSNIDGNGRRRIYKELNTRRLFYVDNLHVGAAAHIEVFDSDGLHLGEADLLGNLDTTKRVPGRTIPL